MVGGAVLKHSRDFNLMRECVLGSALSPVHPGLRPPAGVRHRSAGDHRGRPTASRPGGSRPASRGGVDTTSDAPIAFSDDLRRVLLGLRRVEVHRRPAQAGRQAAPRRSASRSRATASPAPGCRWATTPRSPPSEFGVSREDQDELAAASHQQHGRRLRPRLLRRPGHPVPRPDRDDNLRPDSTVEKLAKLKPVFGAKLGDATMTAGNSTPLTDGASAVAAGHRRVGGRARPAGAGVPGRLRDRRRRLRARRRRVC